MPLGATNSNPSQPLIGLARGLSAARVDGDSSVVISGMEYDSRKVKPGDLFIALVGGYFDGHDFAEMAKERGAAALMVEHELPIPLPQLIVSNTRAALPAVAAEFFGHPSRELTVIGITGTDGKTTTTYLVETILAYAGLRTGVIGTVGVRIDDKVLDADTRQTTPESLDVQRHLRSMVDQCVDVAVLEATSHGLDLHRLDEIRFQIGAVTSITHEHLEHHKTIEAYRRAKARLFEAVCLANGKAVINLDDSGSREMMTYSDPNSIITYSADGADADLIASDIRMSVDGTTFQLSVRGVESIVRTPLLGRFNVANALCAIGVAHAHDISHEISIKALAQTPPIPGRMQSIRQGQPFAVIVDYAHTPDSIDKVLTLLRELNPAGRLILVMGSAGERDREKRQLQGEVAVRLADYSVFTTEDPRFEDADAIISHIAEGARLKGGVEGRDFVCVTDRRQAIEHVFETARAGDCVLLAGKGHERSIIWGHEKRPWDEAAIAAELLMALGFREGPS
jgi:UDP-N-acetylmuramoyl-L-alanyl-D-glutamate--2,6-diaminopimelate ligase